MSMIACIIMAVCGMRLPTLKAPSPRAPVQNRRKVTKNLWISVDKIPEKFCCVCNLSMQLVESGCLDLP